MNPPQSTIYVQKAYTVDYATTAGSAQNAEYTSYFSLSGSLVLSSLNLVGGGVTGSFGTNQTLNISESQVVDGIPINKGNSVKWFVFVESGSNSRANKVIGSWNNVTSSFYATEIKSIGNVPVSINVAHDPSGVYLVVTPQYGVWSTRLIRILI